MRTKGIYTIKTTMKNKTLPVIAILASLMAMSCAVSCNKAPEPEQKTEPEQKENQEPQAPEGPQSGVYTFTASPLKGTWEAGDQIYVHGSYGPAAKTITLTSSDISADGKTASVMLDGVFEYTVKPDYLYAAWPAEAILTNDGMMTSDTEFCSFDRLLSLAYLNGTDFAFADVTSGLKFKVSGYEDYAVSGNQRPGLRFTSYYAQYTSENSYYFGHKDDGYPFLYGKVSEDECLLWLPGTVKTNDGITIYFGNGGSWTMSYTNTEISRLSAGTVTDLGDITAELQAYAGLAPIMPEIGDKTRYTLAVNELSGLCLSADKDFIWGVGDGGDLVKISFEGELTGSAVHISGDTEAISIDPGTGNLLIGMEPNTVGIVTAPEFNKRTNLFKIDDAAKYGNAGQEGLTYYKDSLIYCGMQTDSELYCIALGTGEVQWKKSLRKAFPAITEIADLCYDPLTDWLWVVDSEAKKLFALTGDAETLLGSYAIKNPSNPESLAVDHAHNCIWVGDDYGSTSYLYRYEFTGLDDAIIVEEAE